MGLFKRRDGLQQEREQDPVQQAKEALLRYLQELEERTGPNVPEKEREANIGRERYGLGGPHTAETSVDDIKATVQKAIDLLDKGDIRKTMWFLVARDINLYNDFGGAETYLLEAEKALSDYMEAGIVDGSVNMEDMSIKPDKSPDSRVVYEDLRVPAGIKLPNGQILDEDASFKVLVNNHFAFVKPDGDIIFTEVDGHFEEYVNIINRLDRGINVLEGHKVSFTIPKGEKLPDGRILEDDADIYIFGSTLGSPWGIKEGNKELELVGIDKGIDWFELEGKYHKV